MGVRAIYPCFHDAENPENRMASDISTPLAPTTPHAYNPPMRRLYLRDAASGDLVDDVYVLTNKQLSAASSSASVPHMKRSESGMSRSYLSATAVTISRIVGGASTVA